VPDGVVEEVGDQAFGQARVTGYRGCGECRAQADAVALGFFLTGQERVPGDVGEVQAFQLPDPALAAGREVQLGQPCCSAGQRSRSTGCWTFAKVGLSIPGPRDFSSQCRRRRVRELSCQNQPSNTSGVSGYDRLIVEVARPAASSDRTDVTQVRQLPPRCHIGAAGRVALRPVAGLRMLVGKHVRANMACCGTSRKKL
jgi:hypothetical protein